MDALSRLPTVLLAAIHHQVHLAGGMRSALALEAASKQLRQLFKDSTRFQQEVSAAHVPASALQDAGSSFWRWVAAHGHRVDCLAFKMLPVLQYLAVPAG
jgi:hypothetical protein